MSGTPDNKRKRPVTPTKIDECGSKSEEIVDLPGYNGENQSISSELDIRRCDFGSSRGSSPGDRCSIKC